MMKRKKIVDVRTVNLKKQREWEFAQANHSEADWLRANVHSNDVDKEILVKLAFKDWYGEWVEFQISLSGDGELFLHDDGRYLSWLEKNHADIYPEVKQRFFERKSVIVEDKHGFILKRTGCYDRELPRFVMQMYQYCLELAQLTKFVIEVEEASKLQTDSRLV